jgi:hypothetical protein
MQRRRRYGEVRSGRAYRPDPPADGYAWRRLEGALLSRSADLRAGQTAKRFRTNRRAGVALLGSRRRDGALWPPFRRLMDRVTRTSRRVSSLVGSASSPPMGRGRRETFVGHSVRLADRHTTRRSQASGRAAAASAASRHSRRCAETGRKTTTKPGGARTRPPPRISSSQQRGARSRPPGPPLPYSPVTHWRLGGA